MPLNRITKTLFIVALLTFSAPALAAEKIRFDRIVDGDTFVGNGKKIRLWGINTPEKGKPFYLAASWYLETIIKDGADCEFVAIDYFRRDVMKCAVQGQDVGERMVSQGMAIDYRKYSKGYYARQQKEAQAKRLGIWKR